MMISNNKNKNSQELTLEEIIQKSKFRKNIDNICLLETKINKDLSKPPSLVHTPISSFNKPSEITHFEHFQSKRSIQSTHEGHRKTSNSVTARTSQTSKEPVSQSLLPNDMALNNFKTIKRDELPSKEFKKSKENNLISLEKAPSLKGKQKKVNQFLCVKGASGNVVVNMPKPLTAVEGGSRDFIPEYEMKKYQTLVELGGDIQQKEKSQQLKSAHQTIENKKYHSFMVTKYTTSNNLRQRSVKSKSYSQSKLKHKVMLPEELIKKKIQYRGIKTQEKLNSKIENAQDAGYGKSKQMKKYELILNINHEEEVRKEGKNGGKGRSEVHAKTEENEEKQKEVGEQKGQLKEIVQKVEDQGSPNMTKTKGFKGKKVKSTIQMKTRYFIPDFIKPSLDLVVFEKKPSEKLKTQEKEALNKIKDGIQDDENVNKSFEQLVEGIHGKNFTQQREGNNENMHSQSNGNGENALESQNLANQEQNEGRKSPRQKLQDEQDFNRSQQVFERKGKMSKDKKKKKVKKIEQGQICAWDESNQKNNNLFREPDFDLDF